MDYAHKDKEILTNYAIYTLYMVYIILYMDLEVNRNIKQLSFIVYH
jgi:hypothetical protein